MGRNAVVFVVLLLVIVVAWTKACGSEQTPAPPPQPPPSATEVAAQVPSAPPRTTVSDLRLPKHNISATKLLWKSRAVVEGQLGSGTKREDGRWSFDLGSDGNVLEQLLIRYDRNGRCVSIEVPGARAGYANYADDQKDAIEAWFGIAKLDKINGRDFDYGDAFAGIGLAVYDAEFYDSLTKKVAVAEAPSSEYSDDDRREVAGRINRMFRDSKIDLGVQVKGTTLYMTNLTGGDCDVALLPQFLKAMSPGDFDFRANLKRVGFTQLGCMPEGTMISIDAN